MKQTEILKIAHEVFEEFGYGGCEAHHYRKRGKVPPVLDGIILLSIIPVPRGHANTTHLHDGDRQPLDDQTPESICLLAQMMDEQIEKIIARVPKNAALRREVYGE